MTEKTSSGGPLKLALVALVALGVVVVRNADTCTKGAAKLGDDVVSAGSKAGDGGKTGDLATQGSRGRNALAVVEDAGFIEDGVGLSSAALDLLEARQEEDAGLPSDEYGWPGPLDTMPTRAGTWCAFSVGDRRQNEGWKKETLVGEDGRAIGKVTSLKPDEDDSWYEEDRWEHKEACRRRADTIAGLDEVEWTCAPLVRLGKSHVTVGFEPGPATWVRCGEPPAAVR